MIQKAYKFRIYPNKEQIEKLEFNFKAVRFVYNFALRLKKEALKNNEKLSSFDISKKLTEFKKTDNGKWLYDANAIPLISAIRNFDSAYQNFWKKLKREGAELKNGVKKAYAKEEIKKEELLPFHYKGFPSFKQYDYYNSMQFHQDYIIDFEKSFIKVSKIGNIYVEYHRQFDGKSKTCTISKAPDGKFYISILVEIDAENPPKPEIKEETTIELHMGLSRLIYTENDSLEHKRFYQIAQKRLALEQKRMSKMKFGSNNYRKQRLKVAKLHTKIARQRDYYLHNISTNLIKSKEYDSIKVEDWNIKEMIVNNEYDLQKDIHDASWGKFKLQLAYKSDWHGKNLIEIERFTATSKTCSNCGYIKEDLKLSQKKWKCPQCNTKHDREKNAVENIKQN